MVQAVIMCAGKSTRTYPLTVNKPKPLLKVIDRSILEHNLDQLVGIADEVILVVGFMKEMIWSHIGDSYKDMKITYVEQKEQLGTGHVLIIIEENIKDEFILMPGDDLFIKEDILKLMKHKYACLAKEVDDPQNFGIFVTKDGVITDIEEKPKQPKSNLANTACWKVDKKIIELMKSSEKTERGELEATCALGKLIKSEKVACVSADLWLPVGYPWKYLEANVALLRRLAEQNPQGKNEGKVEDNVSIKGTVFIGKNTIIKSGTVIEGPVFIGDDCEVGPQAYIRKDSILMDKVRTRAEIYDAVLNDGVTAKHTSYIAHSVIGDNSNIAAGTVTADYRHDAGNNWSLVKGKKMCTGRRKLGTFTGENVKTGIGTLIYPGRKLWPNATTLPGQVVKEDIMD